MSTFDANVACGQSSSAASICPVWLASSSIACLPRITRSGFSSLDERLQELRHRERLQLDVGLHQNRAIGAERQRRAQRLLARRNAAGNRDDLGRDALFLQAHGFLDGDLVERIHRHLDVGRVDAGAVGLDADLDVVIDDALDGDQDFHEDVFLEHIDYSVLHNPRRCASTQVASSEAAQFSKSPGHS